MPTEKWLPLTDYSNKYKVSLSTLRRRIKAKKLECNFEDGKYLLRDLPLAKHNPKLISQVPAPTSQVTEPKVTSNPEVASPAHQLEASLSAADASESGGGLVLKAANQLLEEIKRAYAMVLQEKEEQILQLREEAADLKTLVRVLEDDNDRLKTNVREAAPIDSWLKSLDT